MILRHVFKKELTTNTIENTHKKNMVSTFLNTVNINTCVLFINEVIETKVANSKNDST